MRDDELVAAALTGDPAAFAALVEGNRARVEAVVQRMVGEDAEDLVQEALLRAYLGLSELRDPARFGAWLCGIAVNLAKMRLRRRARETRLFGEPTSGGAVEEYELLQLVRDAVDVLPPGQRDVVLMHYVDGLSCEEIAALLRTSPGAVRVRLHRARQQLRDELAAVAPTPKPKEEIKVVEMRIEDVIVRMAENEPMKVHRCVVLLKEAGRDRVLPIWIGAPEGSSLALRMTGETMPRPMTSDLMVELLRVTGGTVERVAVTSIRESTFYAVIAVAVEGRVDEVDARPSDALNLAVRVGAPIFVADDVLEQHALASSEIGVELEAKTSDMSDELPPGEWRSLSAELLQSMFDLPSER